MAQIYQKNTINIININHAILLHIFRRKFSQKEILVQKSNKSELLENNSSAKKTNSILVKPIIFQKGKIMKNNTKVIYFVTQHDQKNINKKKIEFGTNFFKNGKVCTFT